MITKTAQDTIEFGSELAGHLKPNDVIALTGTLGSGKTTLTKGIAKGLGVKNSVYVNSPSFVLIREYKGRLTLYHFDLYRLDNILDIQELGIEEYFYSNGVCVIEWAEKTKELLPKEYLGININILKNSSRQIILKAHGKRYENISGRYINEHS
ncbi:MAG: tRNA (adenosine(37)-N6)-threonylcarbamoyltransferase complex ATPase subunit type 1 TsaE [Candidatus Omnitrophica bacterium]|nr:tRNA (adenosine(37)-N6)-threonylcarbamoyltransferase complex ATPase subunit type 1 TsaE [Candidatus Omnitrophota bacterium]